MKKIILPALALLLALLLALTGCSSHGKTLIKAGGEKLSVNVYQLYLSRMKGDLARAGYNVNSAEFWKQYISTDNTTYADFYTKQVLEGLKLIAASLVLYDELGLKLDAAVEDEIDAWIDVLIEQVGGGSKSVLNSELSAYGANITVLRDAAIIEAKIDQLKTHLYGADGSLLSATAKEEFYKSNYYAGVQMLLANTYQDHDKDTDGQTVYYEKNEDGTPNLQKIAYNKTGENVEQTAKTDKNGDTVWCYKADIEGIGGKVAYDETNGVVNYHYDYAEDGTRTPVIKNYTEAEMQLRQELAAQIAADCVGNEARFLEYVNKWSDNLMTGDDGKPNRMYYVPGVYSGSDILSTISTQLATLEVGQLVTYTDASYGVFIIMRCELDTGAWEKTENKAWFTQLTGLAVEAMLQQKVTPYLDRVKVKEELLAGVDITTVSPNYYY